MLTPSLLPLNDVQNSNSKRQSSSQKLSKLITPKTLPSNDCLNIIFMFKFDKKQAAHLPLRRLNRNSALYFANPNSMMLFTRPKKTLVINHNTDHDELVQRLPRLSDIYDLKVKLNINLSTWLKKVYAFDKKKQKFSNKAFTVVSHFLEEYKLSSFSLNFQLMVRNFDLEQAQQLQLKSSRLKYLRISCSEIQLQSLIVLTQIPNIKKLIIHECTISHCHQALNQDSNSIFSQNSLSYSQNDKAEQINYEDLKENSWMEEFIFYKNRICKTGQRILFKQVLPLVTQLQKLSLPSNQFRDETIDFIQDYLQEQRLKLIRSINLGNNLFQQDGLYKLMKFLTTQYRPLKKISLCFHPFESAESFKRIAELIRENNTIEKYDFEGCNLSIQDIENLNNIVIGQKRNLSIKQLKLGLNNFTEEQLNSRFRSDSLVSNQSLTTAPEEEEKQQSINKETIDKENPEAINCSKNQKEIVTIMDIIEKPLDSFVEGLSKRIKMY